MNALFVSDNNIVQQIVASARIALELILPKAPVSIW